MINLTCDPGSWRIIVIDDEPESLHLVEALFKRYNISITTYDNALDGLNAIQDGNYNILLLDLMIPGDANGWELHRQLHEKEKLSESILIVAFTALAEPEDLQKAADMGFEGYLFKPFDPLKIFVLLGAFVGAFLARRGRPCLPNLL